MRSKNVKPRINSRQHSEFDFFTGGKTTDFAIYYNIAVDNIDSLVHKLEPGKKPNFSLKNETYIALRNYIWKGFELDKNKSGYSVTEDDKELFKLLYEKLVSLRNFHSHIWHNNQVLRFSHKLISFMEEKLLTATNMATQNTSAIDLDYFRKQQYNFPYFKNDYITQEGRVFFLSFFLSKGQMNSFLQQRTGSKRNDLPLYKTKRDIYTHYCHNERAAINSIHLNGAAFEQLEGTEQQEILKARQAYKIISYLNDIPEVYGNQQLTPFFIQQDGESRACVSAWDLVTFCRQNNLFTQLQFEEDKLNDNVLQFTHSAVPDYLFRVSYNHFHILLVQLIVKGAIFDNIVVTKLKEFAAERKRFHQFIAEDIYSKDTSLHLSDETLRFYHIKGRSFLKTLYEQWLDRYLKGGLADYKTLQKLAEQTATLQEKATDEEPEPIVLLSQYFFMGEENYDEAITENNAIPKQRLQQKPRPENRFMQYAVQFLIDHQLTKDWEWQQETFTTQTVQDTETGLTKEQHKKDRIFASVLKEGYRLSINDNQVLARVKENGGAFYLFGIGPHVMRYLLTFHVLDGQKDKMRGKLNAFLLTMKSDLKKLQTAAQSPSDIPVNYALLQDFYIPDFYHNLTTTATTRQDHQLLLDELKKATTRRVDYICNELKYQLDNRHKLSKAAQNRLIMDCYLYFDWSSTPDKKFLRKNEYNKMGICHYLLHDRRKFNDVFHRTFQLSKRIPEEINTLLKQSTDLDDLVKNSINTVIQLLRSRLKNAVTISFPRMLKKELIALAQHTGTSIPDGLLAPDALHDLQSKRQKTIHYLPFDIHPNLVLRFFYKEQADSRHFRHNSLFKQLQQDTYTKGLFTSHYDLTPFNKLYQPHEYDPATRITQGHKSAATLAREKLTGKLNTCHTEDILLWQIAKAYLVRSEYTSKTAADIINCLNEEVNSATVKNLHTEPVVLPHEAGGTTYYIQLRMHQLDNFLFQAGYNKIHDAITHYCNRQQEELQTTWHPPTSTDNAIPLDKVMREIQRIRLDSHVLGNYLLDWERSVINSWCQTQQALTDEQKQTSLKNYAQQQGRNEIEHLNFKDILKMADEAGLITDASMSSQLEQIRNKVLHSNIPTDASFKYKTMMKKDEPATALGELLYIHEPIDTKKDRSFYQEESAE